jgi:hypothetical protein
MALTNAEKQKRWRDRRDALAKHKHAEAMAKEGRLRNQPDQSSPDTALEDKEIKEEIARLQQECDEHESFIETLEEELFDVEDNHDHDRVTERGCSFCGKHPKKVPYGYFKASPAHGGGFIIGKFGTICFECIEEFVKLREDMWNRGHAMAFVDDERKPKQ